MKPVLLLLLLFIVTAVCSALTYQIGTDVLITFQYTQSLELIFSKNEPSNLQLTPQPDCKVSDVTVVSAYGSGYKPTITNLKKFILPVTPDMDNNSQAVIISVGINNCTFRISSSDANVQNLTLSEPTATDLAPGYADFFSTNFEDSAIEVHLSKSGENCYFDFFWGSGNVSEVAYIDELPLKNDYQLTTIIYPYYGQSTFTIVILAYPGNDGSCSITLTATKVYMNTLNFTSDTETHLVMANPIYAFAVINQVPNSPAIQFNITVTPNSTIDSISIRSSAEQTGVVVHKYNETINYDSYIITFASPTSTLYLLVKFADVTSGNGTSLTLTEVQARNISIGQTAGGNVLLDQWNYFATEIVYKDPQYFTVKVTSQEDCLSTSLLMDQNTFPDSSSKGTLSLVSSSRDGTNTYFRYMLPSQITEAPHIFHLGITGIQNQLCTYYIAIMTEQFTIFQNDTIYVKTNTAADRSYYKYVVSPEAVPTYLIISFTLETNAMTALFIRATDIPSSNKYDASIILSSSGTKKEVYVPPRSNEPITIYFYRDSRAASTFSILVEEVFPPTLSIGQQLILNDQFSWSFFSLKDVTSTLVTFVHHSSVSDSSVPVYVGVGELPNEKSIFFSSGQLSRKDVNVNVTSWHGFYFGVHTDFNGPFSVFVTGDGYPVAFNQFSELSSYSSIYTKAVIPKSASILRIELVDNSKDFFISWNGVVNETNSMRIPRQGILGDRYEYSIPLNLTEDTPIYALVEPNENKTLNGKIGFFDTISSTVVVKENIPSEAIQGSLVCEWSYFNIDWSPGYGIFSSFVYDVIFTVHINQNSTRDGLELFYGENEIPTTTKYTKKSEKNGETLEIVLSKIYGPRSPNDSTRRYLAVYAGEDNNASPIEFNISAYYTKYPVKSGSGDKLWIVLGSIFGAVFVIGVASFIARKVIKRRKQGYQPVNGDVANLLSN